MATIKTGLAIQDQMTSVMRSITQSLNLTVSAMNEMQNSMESSFDSKAINAARKSIQQTEATIQEIPKSIKQAEREQQHLNRSFERGNKAADQMWRTIKTIAATYFTFRGVRSLTEATIGGASQIEESQLALNALIGDAERANALFDMLQNRSLESTFSEMDFIAAGRAYLPLTKDLQQIEELVGLTERLGASNPMEGMQGAAFSIREVLSGDYQSIVDRFNLPRSVIRNALDGADTVGERMVALDKVLNNMGFTQEYVNKVNQSGASQWKQLASNMQIAFARAGTNALETLLPTLTAINDSFKDGDFQSFFDSLSSGLARATEMMMNFLKNAIKTYEYISEKWNLISPILWSLIPLFLGLTLAVQKQAIWQGILAVKNGITTASMIAQTAVTHGLRAAWAGLNATMRANIIIMIISLLIALGVWLYNTWKKNDDFAAGLMRAWNSILNFFDRIPAYFWQLVGWLLEPYIWWAEKVGGIYDKVINSIIKGVNSVLKLINKVTGSSYEIAAEFNFENLTKDMQELAKSKKTEAYLKASEKAAEREQKVLDMLDNRAARRAREENEFSSNINTFGGEIDEIDKVGEVGKIKDTVDISSEDLKMMRELAEMKNIQNYITMTPQISFGDTHVRKESDIDTIIARIEDYVEEQRISSANGAYE